MEWIHQEKQRKSKLKIHTPLHTPRMEGAYGFRRDRASSYAPYGWIMELPKVDRLGYAPPYAPYGRGVWIRREIFWLFSFSLTFVILAYIYKRCERKRDEQKLGFLHTYSYFLSFGNNNTSVLISAKAFKISSFPGCIMNSLYSFIICIYFLNLMEE